MMKMEESDQNNSVRQIYAKSELLKDQVLKSYRNLFSSPEAWSAHQELQNLYLTMLLEDLDYALDKKVEVDLWNVCFKNYLSHLQNVSRDRAPLKKKQRNEAVVVLSWFLDLSKGFYATLLEQIRSLCDLDFPAMRENSAFGIHRVAIKGHKSKSMMKNSVYMAQHCYIHLGDIERYKNKMDQAELFYKQAIQIAPGSGQGYNQIALLRAQSGDQLGAAFYYVRSLALTCPFSASASNLERLLTKVEQDFPSKEDSIRITDSRGFILHFLRFQSMIHHAHNLKRAVKILDALLDSLASLIAADAFTTFQLVQIAVITLFMYHKNNEGSKEEASSDETKITKLIHEFLGGMLNALLLPVFTLKQGDALLTYKALPFIKIVLEWIYLNKEVLAHVSFRKRRQIWSSFSKMLNELQNLLDERKPAIDTVSKKLPLPEDSFLQAYLPLIHRTRHLNFKLLHCEKGFTTELLNLLRGYRLVMLGKEFCGIEIDGERFISCQERDENCKDLFEVVEALNIDTKMEELDLNFSSDEESWEEKLNESSQASEQSQGSFTPKPNLSSEERNSPIQQMKKTSRKNVAMAALMRKAANKQVSFQDATSPTPNMSSGKTSVATLLSGFQPLQSSMGNALAASPNVSSRNPPPSRNDIPNRPPPLMSLPTPQLRSMPPNSVRSSAPHSSLVQNLWPMTSVAPGSRPPIMRSNMQPQMPPRGPWAEANNYTGQTAGLDWRNPPPPLEGRSYSLFSGPSWSLSGEQGSLAQSHAEQSPLQKLLNQQKRNNP